MTRPLLNTGLEIVGDMTEGTHFCLFYETRADLIDVVAPYLAAGLQAGELCVWMPSDPEAEHAVRAQLRKTVPDFAEREAAGQVQFSGADAWYRASGQFDTNEVLQRWHEVYDRVLASGYVRLRACGDLGWVEEADRVRVQEYEMALHEFMRERQMVVLCTYPLGRSLAIQVLDVAHAHHLVIARRSGRWESVETAESARAKRELQQLNDELEARVLTRTRQLEEAVARLEREVAERRRAEADLQRVRDRLTEGQRLTHSGSFAWDVATGQYTFWSEEQFRIFGFRPAGVPPSLDAIVERVHPDDRAAFLRSKEIVARDRRDFALTLRLVLPGARTRYLFKVEHPVIDDAGRVIEVVGSDVDITDRKRAVARIARLKRRAREQAIEARFAAILEERTRMAREIHDSLLQGVTGIALQLRATLPPLRAAAPDVAESVRRIVDLADDTARDARQTVWEMRPLSLVDADLPTALDETVRRIAVGKPIRVQVDGDPRPLPPAVEDTVLRVAQESMVNAMKHSRADSIDVTLAYRPASVHLNVTDSGVGFEVESAFRAYAGRWGLLGMRERADRVGASLHVRSRHGAGTTVELEIPLRQQRPRVGA